MRKDFMIAIGVIVLIVVILIGSGMGSYNSLVRLSEDLNNKKSAIDVQLKRRSDLIPNLVNTVKGFTNHETEVIKEVTDARAKLAGSTDISDMANADAELSSALSRLLVVVENYPDLKSNANFIQLSDELAGTENRIAVARKDYNDSVNVYNTKIKSFPTAVYAGMMNFKPAAYFEAQPEDTEVPKVNF